MSYFSEYQNGGGELKFSSPLASELVTALKEGLREHSAARAAKKLSKSEGDLRAPQGADDTGTLRHFHYLHQGLPNDGPQAKCSSPSHFVRTAGRM